MEMARRLVRAYQVVPFPPRQDQKEAQGADRYERIIDALNSIGSAPTRMRGRRVLDPESEEEVRECSRRGSGVFSDSVGLSAPGAGQ